MFAKFNVFSAAARLCLGAVVVFGVTACGGGGSSPAASASNVKKVVVTEPVTGAITLLAGSVTQTGFSDDVGTQARFEYLTGAPVLGPDGDIYVADALNQVVRKIRLSTAAVSTVAGQPGVEGFADGPLNFATLTKPWAVQFDTQGHLWIADDSSARLRRIASNGALETVFTSPYDMVGSPVSFLPQADGSMLFGDVGRDDIRQVTPAGVVSVFAGSQTGRLDGPKASARFYTPVGMVRDRAGNILVADKNSHAIRKISTSGQVSTLAGRLGVKGYADGSGSDALFNEPLEMSIDENDNLYVAEYINCTLRKVTASGVVSTVAGLPGVCDTKLGALPAGLPRNVGILYLGNKRLLLTTNTAMLVLTITSP
jgi:sugar lactone lactonase YvrE